MSDAPQIVEPDHVISRRVWRARVRGRLAVAVALSVNFHGYILLLELGAPGFSLVDLLAPSAERPVATPGIKARLADGARPPAPVAGPLVVLPPQETSRKAEVERRKEDEAEAVAVRPPRVARAKPLPAPPVSVPQREAPEPVPAGEVQAQVPAPPVQPRTELLAQDEPQPETFSVPAAKPVEPAPQRAPEIAAKKQVEEPTEEARRKAEGEQEARRKAEGEQEARRKAEGERRKEEETRRLALEAESQKRAEEEARRKAEGERRKEEEARRLALEAETLKRAEEEARRKAEVERRKEEEARRIALEAEALRRAEELARQQAAARQKEQEAEASRKAEGERRKEAEGERRKAEAAAAAAAAAAAVPGAPSGRELAAKALEQARALPDPQSAIRESPREAPGPRRRAIMSVERDVVLRMYVESWRNKIERNGPFNYRASAGWRARDNPVVTVAIRADGSLEDVVINRSSGLREIDEAARRIVRMYAPYSAFPPDIARRFDVIEIKRVWIFEDTLKLLEDI